MSICVDGAYPRAQPATAEQTSRQQIASSPTTSSIIHQMVSMAWLMLMQMQQLVSGFSPSFESSNYFFCFLDSHTRRRRHSNFTIEKCSKLLCSQYFHLYIVFKKSTSAKSSLLMCCITYAKKKKPVIVVRNYFFTVIVNCSVMAYVLVCFIVKNGFPLIYCFCNTTTTTRGFCWTHSVLYQDGILLQWRGGLV